MLDTYSVLLILRIALVAILYLVIIRVIAVARREMRVVERAPSAVTRGKNVVGHLVVIDNGSTALRPAQPGPAFHCDLARRAGEGRGARADHVSVDRPHALRGDRHDGRDPAVSQAERVSVGIAPPEAAPQNVR